MAKATANNAIEINSVLNRQRTIRFNLLKVTPGVVGRREDPIVPVYAMPDESPCRLFLANAIRVGKTPGSECLYGGGLAGSPPLQSHTALRGKSAVTQEKWRFRQSGQHAATPRNIDFFSLLATLLGPTQTLFDAGIHR
jgi:hypothetical protein